MTGHSSSQEMAFRVTSSHAPLPRPQESIAGQTDDRVARRRWLAYACLTRALVVAYVPLMRSAWRGTTELHTIVEAMGTSMAAIVGLVALTLFYSRKNDHLLYIGTAFLGTAFLDGYHSVVTSSFFDSLFPSAPPSLIPWSWNASRTFLAIMMCLSWWVARRDGRLEPRARHQEGIIYVAVGALTLISFCFFALVPLPRAYYPELMFGRPEEFVAATLFAVALVGYLRRSEWKSDAFEHWCVISLILGMFSQAVVMSRSSGLFDAMFDLAHLLKVSSYTCVFVGLLVSIFHIFRQADASTRDVEQANARLRQSVTERDEAELHLHAVNTSLEERATELQRSRLATLNMMRDIAERETTLSNTNQQLRESQEYVKNIMSSMIDMLVVMAPDGHIVTVNEATCARLGYREEDLVGQPARLLFSQEEEEEALSPTMGVSRKALPVKGSVLRTLLSVGHVSAVEDWYLAKDGAKIPVSFSGSVMRDDDGAIQGIVCVAQDSTERKHLEVELAQAHKLESVGQLAAGIAHEINTPTQYVGDNTRFLKDAFGDLSLALGKYARLLQAVKDGAADDQLVAEVEAALKQADLEYLSEEIPQAIDQSLDGVERVTKIVRAMKEFSHPGSEEKSPVNLTEAIETTITVARNEWKYVADMVTELDPALPTVFCVPGELNQVLLNLIVNAAHAIGETPGEDRTAKGTITVGTRRDGEWVEIFVRDTGTGIPEDVRARIFDPFFTTKEVGKGTGQGLAIARSVVVDKHGGTINCETEVGKGTTFIVRVPINGDQPTQEAGRVEAGLLDNSAA